MAACQNPATRSGLDAALAVAASVGLPTSGPVVLSARGNLVVWIVAMADVFPRRYAPLVDAALAAALA